MNPQELAEWFSRQKMSGAEAAFVLALLHGPRWKHELYAQLPHHRDTLREALDSLEERGFVEGNYGRGRTHCMLTLAVVAEQAANVAIAKAAKPATNRDRGFYSRPEQQQKQVLQRLGVDAELLKASPVMQDRAENLARQMFGK